MRRTASPTEAEPGGAAALRAAAAVKVAVPKLVESWVRVAARLRAAIPVAAAMVQVAARVRASRPSPPRDVRAASARAAELHGARAPRCLARCWRCRDDRDDRDDRDGGEGADGAD